MARRKPMLRIVDAPVPTRSFGTVRKPVGIRPWESGCACPQCGARVWDVRTITAECGSCGEVLPR